MNRTLLSLAAVLSLSVPSLAQVTNWTGANSNVWSDPANWDNGVPIGTTAVVVPATAGAFPSLYTTSPTCAALTIDPGASIVLGSGWDLTVNGALDLGGALTVTSTTSNVTVTGNWVNTGTFVHGGSTVTLHGSAALGGANPTTFQNLVIGSGTRLVLTPAVVEGDLEIAGSSTLDIGANTLTVAGNWSSAGASAAVVGTGTVEFTGDGQLTTLANTLPNVLVSGGLRQVNTSAVAGDLSMTGGTLEILDFSTLTVSGDASLTAGTLSFSGLFSGADVLDVAGNVVLTATAGTMNDDSTVRVAGDWTSTSAWSPPAGVVEMDGTGALGGASPVLADLHLRSGTRTAGAAAVTGSLTIDSGASLVSAAALDVDGDVNLGATASWDLGSSTHLVGGDWVSTGGSATGTGAVVFDGDGLLFTGAATVANVGVSSGTRTASTSAVAGDLVMTGGAIVIGDDQTLSVGGDATLSGGTLSWPAAAAGFFDVLDVQGDATVTASFGTGSSFSRFRVGGNWSSTSAFSPSTGAVSLDSGTAATIGGTAPVFHDLAVASGDKTLTAAATVAGNLTVTNGNSITLSGVDLTVSGATTVSGTVDLAGRTLSVDGNLTASAGSAAVLGPGTVAFTGNGTTSTGANPLPAVLVSGGQRIFATSLVSGDLVVTGGALRLADGATLSVQGSADLAVGSTLAFTDTTAGLETLDVAGDVSLSATAGSMTAGSVIDCDGNWVSDGNWTPAAGRVRLTGGAATASATDLPDLVVVSGTKTFTTPCAVAGNLTVSSGAVLDCDAAIDVAGDVTVGDATSVWDLGNSTHTVAGAYTSSGGSAVGTGTVSFDGPGTLFSGGGSLANVAVMAGVRTTATTDIAGDLTLSGTGSLLVADDAVITVGGDADLTAGTLSWFGTPSGAFDVLDVEGDVVLGATWGGGSSLARFRCAGNWSASGAFVPTAGSVSLDGGVATSVGGVAPTFHDLVVIAGTKTVTAPVVVGNDLIVASGQSLALSGADVAVAGDVTVLGDVSLGGNVLACAGAWSSESAGASVTGPGTVEFTGTGTATAGANALPGVAVSGGVRTVSGATVAGDLLVSAGALRIADNTTLTVGGNATFAAGSNLGFLDTSGGFEVLDVAGDLVCSAMSGPTTSNTLIDVAGDWTSDVNWTPAAGRVRLDGGTAASVSAAQLPSAVVRSGTKTFTAPTTITGSLSVSNGAQLATTAGLSVAGDVTLGDGTSGWALGAATHTVAGDLTSSGGSATGTGTVELTDDGGVFFSGGSLANMAVSAGARSAFDTVVTGDLVLTGGTLTIEDDTLLAVGGNADLLGGTLAWAGAATGSFDVLDVEGDATVSAAFGGGTNLARFRVGGNWTSTAAFAPTAGAVSLDGGAPGVLDGTSPMFFDLRVASGDRTLLTTATVAGDLTVDAGQSLALSGADLTVLGDVVVVGGVDLGGQAAHVAGDWTSDAAGATVTGPGTVDLTATGTLVTGGNSLPGLTVSGGVRRVESSVVAGPLDVTGGTLQLADNATLSVSGAATFALGSTLDFDDQSSGLETLEFLGDVSLSATAGNMTANTIIDCAGDWVSTSDWSPTGGRLRLDGGTAATVDGPILPTVVVIDGVKTFTGAANLLGGLNLASGASLVTPAALDIDGSVSLLDATASWDMGTANHRVAGSWTSTGASATGTGTIEFDGTGTLDTGTGSIGNVLVSDGTRTVVDATIAGDLGMSGAATLFVDDDATLAVGGDLLLLGGTLEWFGTGQGFFDVVDVAGNADVQATFGGGSSFSRLFVGGDWSSTSTFAPTTGLVALDGGTAATIGGTAPVFADLAVANGAKTALTDLTVDGDLNVTAGNSLTLTGGDVDVAGDVTVSGTLDLAGRTAAVSGDWTSSAAGATVVGPGTLAFDGPGTLSTGTNTVPDVEVSAGARSTSTSQIAGNLTVSGGNFVVVDNATVSVAGNASFTGSTLTFVDTSGGFETLDVEGDVVLTAASGGTTANSTIDCAGDWTSSGAWSPSAGRVRFDGGVSTVSAPNLRTVTVVSGDKTFASPTSIQGNLNLISGATLTAAAALDVNGNVFLGDATSTFDLGGFSHQVSGNWTSSGASAVGIGGVAFDGPGTLDTGGGSIPNVAIVSGLRTAQTSTITGNLSMFGSAALLVDDDATLAVGGNASLTGGTLGWAPAAGGVQDVLDVAGNATVNAAFGSGSALARFRVGGDWTSSPAFSPTAGVVQLDGGTVATVGGAGPRFFDLLVNDGAKTVVADTVVSGDLLVTAGQSLTLSGADLTVVADVTVTGTLDMGGRTATVGGDWTSSAVGASVVGPGTVALSGTGSLATGANTVPDVLVTAGTRTASDTAVDGSLTVTGGTFVLADDATVTVSGNADFQTGAVLEFTSATPGPETLDVEGAVTMAAMSGAVSADTVVRCAGDWSSNGSWSPGSGTLHLDGATTTTIAGLAPDDTLAVPTLVLENGVRELASDVTLDVASLTVASAAGLDLLGHTATVPGRGAATPVAVEGALSVGPGGTFALGDPVNMNVAATGTLTLAGTISDPATFSRAATGGYTLTVLGELDASHFVFGGMDVNGVIVSPNATVTDMDPGRFEDPSPTAGSVLLNLTRFTPSEYRYVEFDGSSVGTFNVSTLFGSAIGFVNSSGDFDGESFDNDPSSLVTWTTDSTVLVDFSGTASGDTVTLAWETSAEVDVTDFVLERATSPSGPFTIADQVPATGPGTYTSMDGGLPNATYTYRLVELLTHGATQLLATTTVVVDRGGGGTPPPPVLVDDVDLRADDLDASRAHRKAAPPVSTGWAAPAVALGGFAGVSSPTDLGDALADLAGVRNPVLRLAPGTYAAFDAEPVWEGTLRLLADGAGVVRIDTSDGPLRFSGLDAGRSVELSDLVVGDDAAGGPAVEVVDCAGLVVLDECVLTGGLVDDVRAPALSVVASDRVAVQRTTLHGPLVATSGATVTVGGGALDELLLSDGALARTAGVVLALVDVTGSAQHVDFGAGAHADVDVPEFVRLGAQVTVRLRGAPGGLARLTASPELGWTDGWAAGDPREELVALLDAALEQTLVVEALGDDGTLDVVLTLPRDEALVGVPVALQMVVEDPVTGARRWSNTAAFVPLPADLGDVLDAGDRTDDDDAPATPQDVDGADAGTAGAAPVR